MIDRNQDYILYAVDPIESYRSRQRTESGGSKMTSTSTRPVDARRPDSESNSNQKDKQKSESASAFVVGKGFFTWALAEQGDGQSLVHGRIRNEYADEEDNASSHGEEEGDDNDELDGKILEVSLRLKAASSSSRDQFFDRVKVFQPNPSMSTSFGAVGGEISSNISDQSSQGRKQDGAQRTEIQESRAPQSASSPVTALEREQSQAATALINTPAQQQLLHFLQALQAASNASEDISLESQQQLSAPRVPLQNKSWQHPVNSQSNNSPEVMSNLLRTLTAASPNTAPSEKSPLFATALLPTRATMSTNVPRLSETKSIGPESAASPILGGLTPGYDAGYLSGPSPGNDAKASVPTNHFKGQTSVKRETNVLPSHAEASVKHRSSGSNRSKQCCYNCGVRSQRSWRHLPLLNEADVRFREGSIVFDHGKKLFRACNACGLYFNKYSGVSRPEHVWKEAFRLKKEQSKDSAADNEHGAKCNCSAGEGKSSTEEGELINQGHSKAALARTKQIARTLSEACERDNTRRMSICGEYESDQETIVGSAPARRMASFEEARLKDYVQDSEGVWRTKRSILENPENKRPGRPKGSKTGQGQGRPRERHLRMKKAKAALLGDLNKTMLNTRSNTASSPTAGTIMPKDEKVEGQQFSGSLLAQSSPIRAFNSAQVVKTPGSAINRARYGAPTYLLDSSPATAFQTVLNEAETDWHALCGLSSPRRSPRKSPHGTQSGINPYASIITTSPSGRHGTADKLPGTLSAFDLMKMTSSSPLTRSRVKSGQYQLDDSWFSSEGFDFVGVGKKNNDSSSLTSPASPSPSPAHLKNRGIKRKSEAEVMMLQPGQRNVKRSTSVGKDSQQNEVPLSAERARKAARQARQAAAVGGGPNNGNTIDAGPFMGLDIAETVNEDEEEEEEEEAGRGSPTLSRSLRMRQRSDVDSLSLHASPTSTGVLLDFGQDWARSTSMRELFPTPSPVKQWNMNMNSPSNGLWQSPTSWATKATIPSTMSKPQEGSEEDDGKQKEIKQSNTPLQQIEDNQQQLIRRKPLPATVEDAPSSVNSACSSPIDEEDSLEEGEEVKSANLMDLFEDPYGLLAASGIGVQGDQPGLSMEDFESIELFKGIDFGQQLDFFTQTGSNGVAAHLAPSQGSSSTLKIEGKGTSSKTEVAVVPAQLLDSINTSNNNTASSADFAALLKDPAMQALLAHMQLSPSKAKQASLLLDQNNTNNNNNNSTVSTTTTTSSK